MFKRVILAASVAVFAAQGVRAADEDVVPGMGHKFVGGLIDSVTGVVELPMQTIKGYQKGVSFIGNKPTSKTVGTILGFFRGCTHTVGRTAHGVINVATFWTANRESNDGIGIPLDAQYSWEQGEAHSLFKPSLKEGLMPYPRKLGHGLADGFVGIADLPAQIVAGARAENPATGIPIGVVRGLWFSTSRITTGLADAILFLAPNPRETLGYGYDGSWPWDAFFVSDEPEA